jgi:hypothetical protein
MNIKIRTFTYYNTNSRDISLVIDSSLKETVLLFLDGDPEATQQMIDAGIISSDEAELNWQEV